MTSPDDLDAQAGPAGPGGAEVPADGPDDQPGNEGAGFDDQPGNEGAGVDLGLDDQPGNEREGVDSGLDDPPSGEGNEAVDPAPAPAVPGLTPEQLRRRRVRSLVEWVVVLVGAVVVALVVRAFLFTTFWIPSSSMEPTLVGSDGRHDRVVVNRLSYKLGDVDRGDIIVFEIPQGEPTVKVDGKEVKDLIKRVVGLPGETLELRDGKVFIDGEELEEPYLPAGTRTEPCTSERVFEIPDDAVFVMGDNRGNSRDARCFASHSVKESSIVGRAFVRIWPLSEFDLL